MACISRPRGIRSSEIDGGRQAPYGIEAQVRYRGLQQRCRTIRLTDDARITRNDLAVLHSFDLSRGNVDDHILLGCRRYGRLQAPEIDLQLLQPGICGYIQRTDGPLVGDPGRRQTIRGLKLLQRFLDAIGETRRCRIAVIEVAGRRQPGPKQAHRRIVDAELEQFIAADLALGLRNLRPAAPGNDVGVALDGLLRRLDIGLGERRVALWRV